MQKIYRFGFVAILVYHLLGCSDPNFQTPEIEVEITEQKRKNLPLKNYERLTYTDIKGWQAHDMQKAVHTLHISCQTIGRETYSLSNFGFFIHDLPRGALHKTCAELEAARNTTNFALRPFIEKHFTPFRVGKPMQGTMTGYYQSSIRASRTRGGIYQYPVYGLPANMVRVEMNSFGLGIPPQTIHGRLLEGKLQPYLTRDEILNGEMKENARPILWADDPLDVYVLHIQGSGIVFLDSGEQTHLSYAGNNGHSYRSVIRDLLKKGALQRGQASWQGLRKYLQDQSDRTGKLLSFNPRYIFFKESKESQSMGSLGTALTPEISIAVDPAYVPLGLPVWIESKEIGNRLVVAQDTGNAIKGLARTDFFWGSGKKAKEKAERTYYKIGMIIFVPNALADLLS